jgi:hypothetical protein
VGPHKKGPITLKLTLNVAKQNKILKNKIRNINKYRVMHNSIKDTKPCKVAVSSIRHLGKKRSFSLSLSPFIFSSQIFQPSFLSNAEQSKPS